jgi:hypothetical protein
MTIKKGLLFAAITFFLLVLSFFAFSPRHRDRTARAMLSPASWQHTVLPGELSQPHGFLANNCAACHTPNKGVEAKNCIVCHADNKTVLQRQPSAFHADIGSCSACHLEHQGRITSTTKMDHVTLAHIGLRQVQNATPSRDSLIAWLKQGEASPLMPQLQREESLLNCATCHQTKDRHNGLFGKDCAQCHGTTKWTLPDFRHPSSASQSCNQCHQAPPSHYMMHFQMISMKVACQPNAKVNQCFLCHQTTSWNDIKGVGYYKHH